MKIVKIIFFPINLLCQGLIYFYKLIISPLIPKTCIYYPSCSTYAMQSFRRFGVVKGFYFTLKRLLRCRPNAKGGYDPVMPNIKGEDKWLF